MDVSQLSGHWVGLAALLWTILITVLTFVGTKLTSVRKLKMATNKQINVLEDKIDERLELFRTIESCKKCAEVCMAQREQKETELSDAIDRLTTQTSEVNLRLLAGNLIMMELCEGLPIDQKDKVAAIKKMFPSAFNFNKT